MGSTLSTWSPGRGSHGHPQVAQLVQHIGVAQGYALRLPRRARGVEQGGQPLAPPPGRWRQGCGGPPLQQFLPGAHGQGRIRPVALPFQHHHETQPLARLLRQVEATQQDGGLQHQADGAGILAGCSGVPRQGRHCPAPHRRHRPASAPDPPPASGGRSRRTGPPHPRAATPRAAKPAAAVSIP